MRYASISIDVDTLGSIESMNDGNSYSRNRLVSYEKVLPRFLDLLDRYNIKATFFVIGKDAARRENAKIIKDIHRKGHEIANHTMNHKKNFSLLNDKEIEKEIDQASEIISEITGGRVKGFRAPGYAISSKVLKWLEHNGYEYDSSVNPSFLYLFLKYLYKELYLKGENKNFITIGNPLVGFAPPYPYIPDKLYFWRKGIKGNLIEIPIGVMPFIRYTYTGYTLLSMTTFARKIFWRVIKALRTIIIYELHDTELACRYTDGITGKFLARSRLIDSPLKKRIFSQSDSFLFLSKNYKLLTLSELANKIKQNGKHNFKTK